MVDVARHHKVIDDDCGHTFPRTPRNAILGHHGDVKNAGLASMVLWHKGSILLLGSVKIDGSDSSMVV